MYDIRNLFARYKNITPPDRAVKRAVLHALREAADIHLEEKDIRVVRDVAYIQTESAVKNALFMKKESVLASAQKELGHGEVLRDIQ